MEIIFNILWSLPFILFWSAVLSFVPSAYYLLIQNPPIVKAERMLEKGIIVIGRERMIRRAETRRVRVVAVIYGFCVVIFSEVYFFNAIHQASGIKPLDILSTLSVVLFGFSVITYLPIAIYLAVKNPWQDREEGVCLTRLFIGYGIALLAFSVVFVFRWLNAHQLPIGIKELCYSFAVVFVSSAAISYLPICLYVFTRIANPYRLRRVHPNVLFLIYSLCFLAFASVFITNWVVDKRHAIQAIPAKMSGPK